MLKAQTFSDNFESYTTGNKLGPQSPGWTTWSGVDGGATDVDVVNTDAHSGSNSIYFSSTSSTGGPSDVVLHFGGPLTTGHFTYTSWFKIPAGKTAYFNFQGNATLGNQYALDCFMEANADISIENSGAVVLASTYPVNTWFELTIDVNLNTNTWELLIDGVSKGVWQNKINQVEAIDIYPSDASASYWMDDVSYTITPYTLPVRNGLITNIDFGGSSYLNPTKWLIGQQKSPTVIVKNLGTTPITSFNLTLDVNGAGTTTQTITAVNIASLSGYTVNTTNIITFVAGTNTVTATISNVNGTIQDDDNSDDTKSIVITPVPAAPGKMVVGEEGTGTWCQWCPRGAVFMDMMNTKYNGYFAGIAVHNSDPMTNTAYDGAIGPYMSGYPSAIVDRLPKIDPSEFETDFLTRIVVAPKAFIVSGATYNSSTRVLKVSLTSTIQQNISGNYKIACVITEDDVTGISGYGQSNAYSGGGVGVMGGFERLGNPVAAALMHYNHVARVISPSFAGYANAFGVSATTSQSFTYTFTYTLPAAWDATQIHIVGLFIDPTGKINNASSTTINEAVTTGYVTGIELGTVGITEEDQIDTQVSLYPNPTNHDATISLNLPNESNVEVAIYTVQGALVIKKNYGKLSGGMLVPIEMMDFKAGMYFVNVIINGKSSMLKLIKE